MRVLHIAPFFYPAHVYGGPIPVLYELCRESARAGCEVKALTTNAGGPRAVLDVPAGREVEIAEGVSVRYCRRISGESTSAEMLRALPEYVRRADVVHLSGVYSFPTIPALAACALLGKPVVWSPMGALQRWQGSRRLWLKAQWERICRVVAPRRLVLHVTSAAEAAESAAVFPRVPAAVIPHGVHIPTSVEHTDGGGTLRLLFLGRLDPKKGLENLLDACSAMRLEPARMAIAAGSPGPANERSTAWTLVIAGTGDPEYTRSIKQRIGKLGLKESVYMAGQVTGSSKNELFANADLLVVPSHTENFAMVVVEALAHAVPVIASTGTPWQSLEDAGCGLWVNNDPQSLERAIVRMSGMPLAEMGARGREWMRAEFSWPSVAGKTIELYERILSRQP